MRKNISQEQVLVGWVWLVEGAWLVAWIDGYEWNFSRKKNPQASGVAFRHFCIWLHPIFLRLHEIWIGFRSFFSSPSSIQKSRRSGEERREVSTRSLSPVLTRTNCTATRFASCDFSASLQQTEGFNLAAPPQF